MFDPQEVHGCECAECGEWQSDNQADVDINGVCWDCVDALEEEEVDAEREDWFSVACGVVL